MKKIWEVDYSQPKASDSYCCDNCGKKNVRLWREYQTIASCTSLTCQSCSIIREKKECFVEDDGRMRDDLGYSDQIGWLVPAVPTEEGDTFWGYTSVPQEGVDWWYSLPWK